MQAGPDRFEEVRALIDDIEQRLPARLPPFGRRDSTVACHGSDMDIPSPFSGSADEETFDPKASTARLVVPLSDGCCPVCPFLLFD